MICCMHTYTCVCTYVRIDTRFVDIIKLVDNVFNAF